MRARLVFRTRSPTSGTIRVVDHGRERRLVVNGAILSVLPTDGDWRRVRREYWWHALVSGELPPRPSVLLVGLGGGTQIHLLRALATPRLVTAIERDPVIVRVANDWFGLRRLGDLEVLCAEAAVALAALRRSRRRFDFVMEDVAYDDTSERALALARAAAGLVAPRGTLVVNRHRRADAHALAEALRSMFGTVRLRRVRREAENVLVCALGRLSRRTSPGSA
jgi:spermidine synthase